MKNLSQQALNLRKQVLEANLLLKKYALVVHTWGNVSMITDDRQFIVIKPSGVSYDNMKEDDIVVYDVKNKLIFGDMSPSVDLPTHEVIYKINDKIRAVVHTHSVYMSAFAQAGKEIACFGTTHADNFYGPVGCTRALSEQEINGDYEYNTGLVIKEYFSQKGKDILATPAILVKEHGAFLWSTKNAIDAVDLALTLETVSKMAVNTLIINPNAQSASAYLQKKHYERKHGKNTYYGQKPQTKNTKG